MNRKTFIQETVGALILVAPYYSRMSCYNDNSTDVLAIDDPEATDWLENSANAKAISGNHGHTFSVSKVDIDNGIEESYAIQCSSGHNHTIVVTSAGFNTLKSAKTLKIESSRDNSHIHDVTFIYAKKASTMYSKSAC